MFSIPIVNLVLGLLWEYIVTVVKKKTCYFKVGFKDSENTHFSENTDYRAYWVKVPIEVHLEQEPLNIVVIDIHKMGRWKRAATDFVSFLSQFVHKSSFQAINKVTPNWQFSFFLAEFKTFVGFSLLYNKTTGLEIDIRNAHYIM